MSCYYRTIAYYKEHVNIKVGFELQALLSVLCLTDFYHFNRTVKEIPQHLTKMFVIHTDDVTELITLTHRQYTLEVRIGVKIPV